MSVIKLQFVGNRKFEFVGVNDENFISDWWHYGSWENNCFREDLSSKIEYVFERRL